VKRRQVALFEQPSLVPMADMLTNTVGIMLFILIFASLSAGGAVISKRLPREKPTSASAVWMYCSGGRMVHFEPNPLSERMMKNVGKPTFSTATEWARKFSAQTIETDQLQVSGEAKAEFQGGFFQQSVHFDVSIAIRRRENQGDDQAAVMNPDSAFNRLLALKDTKGNFFFFDVDPDSIPLFRAARDKAVKAGFNVGWSPVEKGEPARIGLTGNGREIKVQ
jgi:hypothetical protein